ncbi:2-hydroxyacid dehydrogenase [Hyphodiscus hymeniophilus]|uniref:2-hydroxyacid dehydrogenase n=1 Tax=Hyphodiscus hymeniophilus TaxID=353542 RepID=A0A9P7AX12_9HELO|nr:2-hydroxyacid dehydrogenase [Hyphodiscus hymeniophilus]
MLKPARAKPRVLALMPPTAVGNAFLDDFRKEFVLDVLLAVNHAEAVPALKVAIADSGPYQAFMVLMGTAPFEPFDYLESLLPDLKIIVSASAGYNEFPVDWMTRNEVWFCNTRNAIAEPTADMAIFLILAVVRDMTRSEKSARAGLWRNDHVPCTDPTGLTLGIIGLGAIGKHLAKKAAAFNFKVQYHNRTRLSSADEALYNATYCPTLENLLQTSDVISVNCPLNATTTNLISHKEFAKMKHGAFLVNTARGAIVNEAALIEALESGRVCRAGLDVFEAEPSINKYFVESDKCIIQPHLGGLTTRARRDGEIECFENIKALFNTGRPVAPVNEVAVAK